MTFGLEVQTHRQTLIRLADFPHELVCEVFHHAARLSTDFCLALCHLSSWTRGLALPHLYSTVILKIRKANDSFLKCIMNTPLSIIRPSLEPLKAAVRGLWVEARFARHKLPLASLCFICRSSALSV